METFSYLRCKWGDISNVRERECEPEMLHGRSWHSDSYVQTMKAISTISPRRNVLNLKIPQQRKLNLAQIKAITEQQMR